MPQGGYTPVEKSVFLWINSRPDEGILSSKQGNQSTENHMGITKCTHIKVNGLRCGSPALRNRDFCYFHHRQNDLRSLRRERPEIRFEFPLLEDANAIQMSIQEVVSGIFEERIDPRRAGLLLYAFSTAAANLKNASFEPKELRQQDEQPSELVRILIEELELDLPGMPPRKKKIPPVEPKEGAATTA